MDNLRRLISPRSIAVFGGEWAAEAIRQCRRIGFTGDLWPVHPQLKCIEGLKVYPSVAALPGPPDAAFIGVNREITVEIVGELAGQGAGGAVCFSSGFAETLSDDDSYGKELQTALIEASGDMPILGPNCYGFINYFDAALIWPDQHGGRVLEKGAKGVAIITQSSNIAINFSMQRRGLPIGYLMTVGNQANVGLAQLGLTLLDDPRVTCLGMHVEGFDSIEGFEQLAHKAYQLGKPIAILKIGKSEQAQQGTLSHTASLAGSHAASQAFINRLGMAEVTSLPTLLDTLKLLHSFGALPGSRLSAMVCSGGEASLIADLAVGKQVEFPPLPLVAQKETEAALGPLVTVANPLDFHTYIWANKAQTSKAFAGMLMGDFDLNILIQDFPIPPLGDHGWRITAEAFIEARETVSQRLGKTINTVMVASLSETVPEQKLYDHYMDNGLLCFGGFAEILLAAEASAKVGACWQQWDTNGLPAALLSIPPAPTEASTETPWMMKEDRAKLALSACGVSIPTGKHINKRNQAIDFIKKNTFPLVAKALGIAHKTEQGAVRLGIDSELSLVKAVDELFLISDNILLESMVTNAVGELIIGITRDSQHGFCLTLGMGGTLVELLKESVTLLLPTDEPAIRTALLSLKIAPLFDSYRGQAAWDLEAVIDAVLGAQRFALKHHDTLLELDINPLLVCTKDSGAVAVDALALFNSEIN